MIWVPITEVEEMGIQNILHSVAYRKSVMVRHKPIAQIFRRFLEDKCFPAFQAGSDPIVISLDKRGRLVHYNALHMILTWRDQLYQETTMSHDLLPSLENELRERTSGADRVIDDIDTQIHDFASEVRKNINNWVKDMKDKMKSSMRRDERKDEIMQGVKKLLAYEGEGSTVGVWALLSKGNRIIACDMGDKMLGVLNEYEKWKDSAQINGFERAFKDCYDMLNSSSPTSYQHSHCFLNYPSNLDKIPDTQSCPQCNHNMHKSNYLSAAAATFVSAT
nr:protein SIEVE ELEMENT OCCLUSION B-like [Ipomoea batatas]